MHEEFRNVLRASRYPHRQIMFGYLPGPCRCFDGCLPGLATYFAGFKCNIRCAVKFFSKSNQLFLGYFDPINIFFDNKPNTFSGLPTQYFGLNGNTDDV